MVCNFHTKSVYHTALYHTKPRQHQLMLRKYQDMILKESIYDNANEIHVWKKIKSGVQETKDHYVNLALSTISKTCMNSHLGYFYKCICYLFSSQKIMHFFRFFTFCIDHDRIIPTTKAIKVHVCLATKPKTLLRKNKMVPAIFSTRAVNASLALLASGLRTFAFYLTFFPILL